MEQLEIDRPADALHLAVHEGHATHLTDRDRILVDATRGDFEWNRSWVGDAGYIRERVSEAGESGTTEIIYNPAGPAPLREIRAFAEATIGYSVGRGVLPQAPLSSHFP